MMTDTIISINDLDFLTVRGIKEVVKYNRDLYFGCSNTTRSEYYRITRTILQNGSVIKVPYLNTKDFRYNYKNKE